MHYLHRYVKIAYEMDKESDNLKVLPPEELRVTPLTLLEPPHVISFRDPQFADYFFKPANHNVEAALDEFDENRTILVDSLQSDSRFGSTLEMLHTMQAMHFHSHLNPFLSAQVNIIANEFVVDNAQAIAERLDSDTVMPGYRNLALAVLVDSFEKPFLARPRSPTQRIDIVLNHFEECLEAEVARKKPDRAKGTYYEIDLKSLAGVVFAQGDSLQKQELTNKLLYVSHDSPAFQEVAEVIPRLPSENVKPFLVRYQLDTEALQAAWKNAEGRHPNFANSSIETILQIEARRPGIAKALMDDFGIKCFGRYSKEMLIDMYDKKDDRDMPFGVVIMPEYDHNGAFGYKITDPLSSFYKQITDLGYATRIYEVGSKYRLGKALVQARNRSSNKISFAVLSGHGSSDLIAFGDPNLDWERSTLQQSDFKGRGVKRIGDLLTDDCYLILDSCFTGEEGGLKSTILETYPGIRVVAPDTNTSVRYIKVSKNKQGQLEFEVYWEDPNPVIIDS